MNTMNTTNTKKNGYCHTIGCDNGIGKMRAQYGHMVCKSCGEKNAQQARLSWCVVQEYGKGGYTLVTPESAPTALKQTNQKDIRG